VAIPQGVAADAFYAKGTSSVAKLFEILCAIKDEATRQPARVAAPIWIPGVPIHPRQFPERVLTLIGNLPWAATLTHR
jgi:hypothetical protein